MGSNISLVPNKLENARGCGERIPSISPFTMRSSLSTNQVLGSNVHSEAHGHNIHYIERAFRPRPIQWCRHSLLLSWQQIISPVSAEESFTPPPCASKRSASEPVERDNQSSNLRRPALLWALRSQRGRAQKVKSMARSLAAMEVNNQR